LTKPEVLVMINLGVGLNKTADTRLNAGETRKMQETETIENGDGDLLDKVERHINSTEGVAGTSAGNGHASNEDTQMHDGQEDNPDITVLNTIIEEMYDRFSDADINEILQICGEVLGGEVAGNAEVNMRDR
jgi:hypothetical protein